MISPAPLIWINGFPGSGKKTIAIKIHASERATVLLDNHTLIDPVEAKYRRDHPDYQHQRQLYRQHVFDQFVCDSEKLAQVIIFTDFQSDNVLGRSVAAEYQHAAQKAGRLFLPVYLTCDVDENVKRVNSADRVSSGTNKLTDPQLLRSFYSTSKLLVLSECRGLTIDTTHTSPDEAAVRIWAFVDESHCDDDRAHDDDKATA